MKDFSYITNSHPAYIESLYQDFVKDPNNVDEELKKFFEGFDFAVSNGMANNAVPAANGTSNASGLVNWTKEIGVYRLILGYRNKGHLIAKTNPIRTRKDRGANLHLDFFGLSESDLDQTFYAGNYVGLGHSTLRQIIAKLEKAYAGHVGYLGQKRSEDQ
ncbi:MAG: hypothetical protein MUF12_03300 [Sediminibacterium sp.]|nr:hypothetical protein [Sediminibacterium sp.]